MAGKVVAGLTTSVDGYYAGPEDGPGCGLGVGGERLHYWVFGGPWTYDSEHLGEPTGADREVLDEAMARVGAVICGRGTFEAADRWGGANPWPVPVFVVTHERPEPVPGFAFVSSVEEALTEARAAAGEKDVSVMGGGEVIRQALQVGAVDELAVTTAPVVLGAGKRLFDGFEQDIDLAPLDVRPSQYATHIRYQVLR